MTVAEQRQELLRLVTEIKTDVTWIKKANDEQNQHLQKLNGKVAEHEKQLSRLWVYIGVGSFIVTSVAMAAVRMLF